MNATATRSTAQAGSLQAGDALGPQPVAALLAEVRSTRDADALHPILTRRLAAAEAAVAGHGEPDPILEDAEHAEHTEEHARLQREVDRCRVALDRLAERRAALAVSERQAAARDAIKAAEADATEAERLVKLYTEIAARLGDVLDQLDQRQRGIIAAREGAAEAGIADEAAHLRTPHERRFQPARFELVAETVEPWRGPRITDAEGRELGGRGGRDFSAPQAVPAPTRRMVEKMVSPPQQAPDLTRVAVELPSPEPGAAPLVHRRGGR